MDSDTPTGAVHTHPADATPQDQTPQVGAPLDLDGIERDLAGVEVALARLEAGTYWTDEVTGAPIADETLATNPVTRRA